MTKAQALFRRIRGEAQKREKQRVRTFNDISVDFLQCVNQMGPPFSFDFVYWYLPITTSGRGTMQNRIAGETKGTEGEDSM